jgi:hypothetical protein
MIKLFFSLEKSHNSLSIIAVLLTALNSVKLAKFWNSLRCAG